MRLVKLLIYLSLSLLMLLVGSWYYATTYLISAPTTFRATNFTITPGESLQTITQNLQSKNIVRSAQAMQFIFTFYEDGTQVKAGTFEFTKALPARDVAKTLIAGQFDTELITLTFIEGKSVSAFGQNAAATIVGFDVERWENLTTQFEGKLFPDTYKVPPDFTAEQLATLLRNQHDQVLFELEPLVNSSARTREEVIILASIVEREANTLESMRTVAGIFQNRIEIGMPLQADATIEYVLETPLGELPPGQLAAELRDVESPYNTYKNRGLPPTPIGNPGRQALEAVLDPIASNYLYYITGNDGEFYYATSYNQHLLNIERHLR